jgi:hypothetical protein
MAGFESEDAALLVLFQFLVTGTSFAADNWCENGDALFALADVPA